MRKKEEYIKKMQHAEYVHRMQQTQQMQQMQEERNRNANNEKNDNVIKAELIDEDEEYDMADIDSYIDPSKSMD